MNRAEELVERYDYAIVDRAGLASEPWHDEMPLIPLVPKVLRSDAEKMPALLALKSLKKPHLALLDSNLEEAEKKPFVNFMSCLLILRSGTEEKSIIHHLMAHLVLHTPQDDVLLRYYDPRVFPHLWEILRPSQMLSLYGPVKVWAFRFQNEWVGQRAPRSETVKQYWSVTAEQREKLDRVMLINEILALRKMKMDRPWYDVEEYEDARIKVGAALERARRDYGLRAESDLTQFALDTLAYGENFHLHPRIRGLLQEMQKKRMSYIAATANVKETDWAQIAV